MHPYNYVVAEAGFSTRLVAATSQRSHYEVAFPASHTTVWEEGNTVYGEYFVPAGNIRSPLAILVPGFGDESLVPCLMLARNLTRQGVSALVISLVFHSRRMPAAMKGQYLPPTSGEWLEAYRVSVCDIRKALDWASGREEIDTQNISIVGISMGGMISSIAMAMDWRIGKGVFVVTGGNLEELSWSGASDIIKTGHTCTREDCHQVYSQYPRYLDDIARQGIENVVPAKECFLFDPLTFAGSLRGRQVLLINAEQDEIIPRRAALEFWEACGKPTIKWLPTTHAGMFSHLPTISREVSALLKE